VFPPSRYLAWASRLFGTVELELATSGIPLLRAEELAPIAEEGARRAGDAACFAELREKIAVYNDVALAEVVPALGASQAIHLAYAAMLSPGDEILVENPGYEPLVRAAEGLGARVRRFARDPARGYRVDLERVAAAMTPRTRAVAVSNLHNPSGVREDDATLAELAAVCGAQGSYLVVDEVYAPFDGLAQGGVFTGSARKLAPNVVALGSLTKGFGLGMLRVGWVLGPEEIVARAGYAAMATVGHLPLAHAAFGLSALARIETLSGRARGLLGGKRAMAEAWARGLGLGWSAPAAGLFGLATVPGAEGRDLLPDIEAFAAEHGVLVSAGTFFGVPDGFRLSWASCDEARFAEGLARLASMPVIAGGGRAR
jgi:aspartate/methionine/tyrosine aminotransferase